MEEDEYYTNQDDDDLLGYTVDERQFSEQEDLWINIWLQSKEPSPGDYDFGFMKVNIDNENHITRR